MKTPSNANWRPQIWAKTLFADTMASLYFVENGMMGENSNNIIQLQTDLEKKKGDRVNFRLRYKRTGRGVRGDNELEGNEERGLDATESVLIDQMRFAELLEGTLDEQKNGAEMRGEMKEMLKIQVKEFIEQQFFLKAAGVTNPTITDVNGVVVGADYDWSNTPDFIPDADEAAGYGARYLCASATGTDTLAITDLMTPDLIDRMKAKAETSYPKIMPLIIKGKPYYLLFIHPWQYYDLRRNPEWAQAMREAERRGEENPIFSGAEGIWNGVIVHKHEYVPFLDVDVAGNSFRGVATGTNCLVDAFRALFIGKQAVGFAKAQNLKKEWVEKNFDYDNQYGVATSLLGGIQKLSFTHPTLGAREFGVIACDTAATAL